MTGLSHGTVRLKVCSTDPSSLRIRGYTFVMVALKFTFFFFRLQECFVKNNRETALICDMIISSGESNGNLPLRICPGCSVPGPYRSPDWVLVPANTGLRAEY